MNFCDQTVIESHKVAIIRRGSILDIGQEEQIELEGLKHFRHINYIGNGWAKENIREFEVEWTVDTESAIKMVAHNRTDVFITGEYPVRYLINLLGLNEALVYRPVNSKLKPLHKFGLRKTFPDSQRQIEAFCGHLIAMKSDGGFNKIFARFL